MVSAARSTFCASSPGATDTCAFVNVGGWLSGGSTVIGRLSVALRPLGSSGPVPSVTSKVIASSPKKPCLDVYTSVRSSFSSGAPLLLTALTLPASVIRTSPPPATATYFDSGRSMVSPLLTSTGLVEMSVGASSASAGTKMNAEATWSS